MTRDLYNFTCCVTGGMNEIYDVHEKCDMIETGDRSENCDMSDNWGIDETSDENATYD